MTAVDRGAAPRILIVEDDRDLAVVVRVNLERTGCVVDLAESGAQGLGLAVSGAYDLLLLDLKLPDISGVEICRKMREIQPQLPILMLTSRSAESDKLLGFKVGADDYLTKPFSMPELLARVQALLRRAARSQAGAEAQAPTRLTIGALEINLEKRAVRVRGRDVELTATEFDLLAFLAAHPGRAFSREDLLKHVWGYEFSGYESTVNVHINRVRTKIEECPARPRYVLTVWGVGYRFVEEAELKQAA